MTNLLGKILFIPPMLVILLAYIGYCYLSGKTKIRSEPDTFLPLYNRNQLIKSRKYEL
jgi:hypothetical protein